VRWTLSVPYIFLSSWLSLYQKLSNLVDIWRSSDKNKLSHFFGTPYMLAIYWQWCLQTHRCSNHLIPTKLGVKPMTTRSYLQYLNCYPTRGKFTKHLRTILGQFYDILHTHANVLIHKTSDDNFTTKVLRSLFRCLMTSNLYDSNIIWPKNFFVFIYKTFNSIILVI